MVIGFEVIVGPVSSLKGINQAGFLVLEEIILNIFDNKDLFI